MSEGLVVQYCRCSTQPNVGLKLCHLCISAVMIASFAQVEQADTDVSVCDVIVQGSMPDCCSAVLQILHHASAAHSQSSDLSNVVQPVWQLKQQVRVCVSSTQERSNLLAHTRMTCIAKTPTFRHGSCCNCVFVLISF